MPKPETIEQAANVRYGTKQTCRSRPRMSAFGGKADMTNL